jgi:tetratricopeptide (TPR) repeat protein
MGVDRDRTGDAPQRDRGDAGGNVRAMPPRGGERVGRYVILYRLGEGGMGVVYAAYDPQLDRKIAIKLVRASKGRSTRQAAMLHEAQLLARLSDPHVVAIHDVGMVDDAVFVAMDFVDGETLRRWAVAPGRKVAEIVAAYRQAGAGLAAAHRAGIVHRDFKPDNALVDRQGRVQVLDFGLAHTDESATPDDPPPRTHAGRPTGTPVYMAPEQHRREPPRPASDQFSFCVSLYEALWRRLPWGGLEGAALTAAIVEGPPVDAPRLPGVTAELRKAILRGLERDPAARHPSMDALLEALARATARGRRRRRSQMVAAIVATGAVAWVAGRTLGPATVGCDDADRRLSDAWSDERAAAVEQAFAQTGRPHATRTAATVHGLLDAYTTQWTSAWRDACEATHVFREQSSELLDLRMACLDQRRQRLDALVGLFAEADGPLVDRAAEATLALPEVAACADTAALRRRASGRTDPQARAELDDVASRISQAQSLDAAGRFFDGATLAEIAAKEAGAIGDPALVAEANLAWGLVLDNAGRHEQAAEVLRRAAIAAEDADDDRLLTDARTALVAVVGERLQRIEEANVWADLARASLERIGRDPRRESRLEQDLALVLEYTGKLDDVLVHQRRALALASEPGATNEVERARLFIDIAMTLAELGAHDEALERGEAGLEIWRNAYGEDHPRTAAAMGALGVVHDRRGDMATARQWYETSFLAYARALGQDNPRTAEMLGNLAIAEIGLGDVTRAVEHFERALSILRTNHPGDDPAVAGAHQNLGSAYRVAGRHDDALEQHRAALAMRERLFGPEDPRIASSLVGLANVLEESLGRPAEALVLRERALAVRERAVGPDDPSLCLDLANLAHNLLATGDVVRARARAERAMGLASSSATSADDRAYATIVLARILASGTDAADREHARALVDRVRASATTSPDDAVERLVAATQAALAAAATAPK